MRRRALTAAFPLVACLPPFAIQDPATLPVADYVALTNNRREFTNFNVETVRGMAFSIEGYLYALNTHGSQVVVQMDTDAAPEAIWQTLLYPVAIATWGNDRVVVAGAGTHALALHDRTTGDVLNVLQLPSEPADLVIDAQANWAFVSCQGADVVVRVDLTTFQIADTYPIDSERPRFLYLDLGANPGISDDRVYVAPFLSGNNSITVGSNSNDPRNRILDLNGNLGGELPDQDLFLIDPFQSGAAAVTPVLRRAGTLLTAHGRNPSTGAYWMLNVESLNKDPQRTTEAALRGSFARNRLSIATTLGGTPLPVPTSIDLDLPSAQGTYSSASACAFPFALEFVTKPTHALLGCAFVTSPLDDRVVMLSSGGTRITAVNLPPGSIPLDLTLDPLSQTYLYVYCWGSNKVLVYHVYNLAAPVLDYDLGLDPTPPEVRDGRALWYDGKRSENARTSCNTCHPGGKSDFMAWPISGDPADHKDVMVTQSLLGIEDTFPYHWRGERDLAAFNQAFVGLLGGPGALTPAQFAKFQAFVFSLSNQANPIEHLERRLHDELTPGPYPNGAVGFATGGQSTFHNKASLGSSSCVQCHAATSGTSGDVSPDGASTQPTAGHFEVAHLRELRHKQQRSVSVTLPGSTTPTVVARNGFGFSHNGGVRDLFEFHNNPRFTLTTQELADVTSFVLQFDTGMAPAAHAVWMLDQAHAANSTTISSLLLPQVQKGWIDVVAFGTFVDINGSGMSTKMRWLYDAPSATFVPSEPLAAPQPFATFVSVAQQGQAALVILGLPPGNGRRFALDPDNDRLSDGDEIVRGTDLWRANTDGDPWPDGYEVANNSNPLVANATITDGADPQLVGPLVLDHVTARTAKFFAEADEEVTISATFQTSGGPVHTYQGADFARTHTIVLQGLQASMPQPFPATNSYTATFTLADRAGRTKQYASAFVSGLHTFFAPPIVTGVYELNVKQIGGTFAVDIATGNVTASVNPTIQFLAGRPNNPYPLPSVNRIVLAQVLRRPVNSKDWSISTSTVSSTGHLVPGFTLVTPTGNQPYTALPGPFLMSDPTGSQGVGNIQFQENGMAVGDSMMVHVIGIFSAGPGHTPSNPILDSVFNYQMPTTDAAGRDLVFTR